MSIVVPVASFCYKLYNNVSDPIRTLAWISWLWMREGLDNPFSKAVPRSHSAAYVLGSGPSFKEFLADYDKDCAKYSDGDYFAVNFFVNDNHFTVIKPAFYVMSDPIFFQDSIHSERGHGVMKALAEKVTWPMIVYVPRWAESSDYLKPLRNNSCIEIRSFHSRKYAGGGKCRFRCYNKGWGNGEFGTVVLNAAYIALLSGYKRIYLYGIDHNFFDKLAVDDDNRLCFGETHYDWNSKLRPLYKCSTGETDVNKLPIFTMCEFLEDKRNIFFGHEIMAAYARSLGAEIYNCTPNSMVDAYKRLKK